jgi:hypothetical protein
VHPSIVSCMSKSLPTIASATPVADNDRSVHQRAASPDAPAPGGGASCAGPYRRIRAKDYGHQCRPTWISSTASDKSQRSGWLTTRPRVRRPYPHNWCPGFCFWKTREREASTQTRLSQPLQKRNGPFQSPTKRNSRPVSIRGRVPA